MVIKFQIYIVHGKNISFFLSTFTYEHLQMWLFGIYFHCDKQVINWEEEEGHPSSK